jgi:hypothetical protein
MISSIVKLIIFLFLLIPEIGFTQPPDEEILYIFTNTVDNFRISYDQLKLPGENFLKGSQTQKGFCALVEKYVDYKKFAQLTVDKLKFEIEPNKKEKAAFLLSIKSELANYFVKLIKIFPENTDTQLRIKYLHSQYALVQVTKPMLNDVVFLTERESRAYPILDVIENDTSKLSQQQQEFQNILNIASNKTLDTLVESLNSKNLSPNNYGLCE